MEDQSPYVSSSQAGRHSPEPDNEQLYRGADEPQPSGEPWGGLDDVLDLTGGQYNHPPFNVAFPTKTAVREEDEDKHRSYSDSLEPSPEEEEPSSIGSDLPRAQVLPSAPAEEHDTAVAAPYSKAPSSGSVDVNLFPLPAASAPLMHSSADNVMDFQQPSPIEPAGKEDLSSLLLESTASLPPFSLSADYAKERSTAVSFLDGSTSPAALQGYDYSESHKFTTGLGEAIEDNTIFSERGFTVEHPTSELESLPVEHAKVYTQSAKEMFSGMLKSVGPPHEEFLDLKEGVDEHYVDFKPFASSIGHDLGYDAKDAVVDFKSNLSNLNFESIKPVEKYSEEKDIDLSDDISPASPEAISDSSNYEIFPPLQHAAPLAHGGNPFADNKYEEKRLAEMETSLTSHTGSKVATVNPFLEHLDQQVDYVSTDSLSGIAATEGLTPDIVQEVYESEVYEAGAPKLNYEPKIDLVQTTAKASQENVSPTAQNTALFEDSDSVSSPVLPDIVMEAPLTSAPVGLNTIAPQPDVSPIGHVKFASEKIKSDYEKPPSYDDAVNKASLQEKEPVVSHVEKVKAAQAEETEAPYISIACDLIKETIPEKVTDFSKALSSEFESQFTSHYDESSPESEPSEPSYKHWELETISKVAAPAVGSVKSPEVTLEKELESDLKWNEQVPSKAYLESESYMPDKLVLTKEPVTQLSSQEKPLQMEAFGKVYSEEPPKMKEPTLFEKSSTVPTIDEFISKPSRDARAEVKETKPWDDHVVKEEPKKPEEVHKPQKAKESDQASDKLGDIKTGTVSDESISKPKPPAKSAEIVSSSTEKKPQQPSAPLCLGVCTFKTSVVDLLYWRDIKKSGAVFGASLFLLLSLTVFSIVSVSAYIALALLSVSISFRIYKGVLQAIQKSDEGHPFKSYLEGDVSVSEDLVKKYSTLALGHINCTIKELRRLFLVEDLVDSLKFAVLMWVFTYIGALFNGLTLLILALISLFSIPVVYERHQTQVDHYLSLINKNVNNVKELILSKVPGLKRKAE